MVRHFLPLLVAVAGETYCPGLADFDIAWGSVSAEGNGWRIHAEAGVHGRTSYNLLGGSIELDYDACGGVEGVNNNIYTISPNGGMVSGYCDIQSNDSPICMELDIDENNGNELGQTTWHIWGNKSGGCDQNGCLGQYWLNPCKYHMRTEFAEDGGLKQFVNGVEIKIDRYGPDGEHASLGDAEKKEIVNQMNSNGAAIISTQWSGWVPGSAASRGHKSHNLSSAAAVNATFAITNVVVNAPQGIKFGPAPPTCQGWIPAPTAVAGETYCPSLADFDIAWGSVSAEGNGWRIHAEAGVHGRTSYNLLGGSIELDYDACGGVEGVNNNIYTISPNGGMVSGYCDIQSNDSPICMELDIDENNGNELGQTTWHIWGNKSGGCDQNGCLGQYWLNPCKYHMRTEFAEDGGLKQFVNGVEIKIDRYGPDGEHASLGDAEKKEIVNQMNSNGAAIISTQWSGWVPGSAASRGHKSHGLSSAAAVNATFAITNVVVNAPQGIKFGPAPPTCQGWIPAPTLVV